MGPAGASVHGMQPLKVARAPLRLRPSRAVPGCWLCRNAPSLVCRCARHMQMPPLCSCRGWRPSRQQRRPQGAAAALHPAVHQPLRAEPELYRNDVRAGGMMACLFRCRRCRCVRCRLFASATCAPTTAFASAMPLCLQRSARWSLPRQPAHAAAWKHTLPTAAAGAGSRYTARGARKRCTLCGPLQTCSCRCGAGASTACACLLLVPSRSTFVHHQVLGRSTFVLLLLQPRPPSRPPPPSIEQCLDLSDTKHSTDTKCRLHLRDGDLELLQVDARNSALHSSVHCIPRFGSAAAARVHCSSTAQQRRESAPSSPVA